MSDCITIVGLIFGVIGTIFGIVNSIALCLNRCRDYGKSFKIEKYGIAYGDNSAYDDLDIIIKNRNKIKNLGIGSVKIINNSSEIEVSNLRSIRIVRGQVLDESTYFRQLEQKKVRMGIRGTDRNLIREKEITLEIVDTDDKNVKVKFQYRNTNGELVEI